MSRYAERTVEVIQPTIVAEKDTEAKAQKKIRVAAYARVSTEQDEQQNSYAAQVDYFTKYIKEHPEWEFVEVYSDEGISGTSLKKRDGFNRMIADAEAGKIDLILVKSISRFARNTVDALTITRKLKAAKVDVIFEKEGLHLLTEQGETMLTIMASIAQEESHNISQNVTWGHRKSMMDGNVSMPYSHFLGYRKGADDKPEIDPEQAETVRLIYDLYLKDTTIRNIAKILIDKGIKTPSGKDKWSVSTIRSILSNEKYKGEAIRQKSYTVDYLTKKTKKNEGELTMYRIRNSHPAIIEPRVFDLVQEKLKENGEKSRQLRNNSPFTTKIICGDCGAFYGRKVYHSTEKCRYESWCCNHKYADEKVCASPRIKDTDLKRYFMTALCRAKAGPVQQGDPVTLERLEEAWERAEKGLDGARERLMKFVEGRGRGLTETEFITEHERLSSIAETHKAALEKAESEILAYTARQEKIRRFKKATEKLTEETAYSDELVTNTLEQIKVMKAKEASYKLEFAFTNETIITIEIGEKSKCAV